MDTVRRYWNICAKCYNRFLRGVSHCPACKSLEFSPVLAAVSEAEIELAKEELLAKMTENEAGITLKEINRRVPNFRRDGP